MEGFLHCRFVERQAGFVTAFGELLSCQDSVLLCVLMILRGPSQYEILLSCETTVSS